MIILNGFSGKNIGGGDYHMLRVMREWSITHQISLVTPRFAVLCCKPLLSDRYKIYLSSTSTKGISSLKAILSYLTRIFKSMLLRFKDKPDVIVCTTHLLYDTLPGYILQLRSRAQLVVYVYHIIAEHAENRTGILSKVSIFSEKLSLRLTRSANIIFVDNEDIKTNLIKMRFDPNKIFVTTNGVDYDAITSVGPVDRIIYDACFCGRLVKTKGIYDLIDIWKFVTNLYPDAKLAIVGDGPEYATFLKKIKEAGLYENIQLLGFVPEQEKFLTMQRSKIFIFPSYEEGWGIAVAEAIASGLEVVAYDLPAFKPFEGHLIKVEKGKKGKMAETIVEILENGTQIDPRNRQLIRSKSILDWKDVANDEMQIVATTQTV